MTIHKPVLLKETLELLNLKEGAVVVDATLGGGGHAREILKIIGKKGKLVAIDADGSAIDNFKKEFSAQGGPAASWQSEFDNLVFEKNNYSGLKSILGGQGIKTVDGILADLGYSSDQIENAERGFSFQKDGRLDMRFDTEKGITAEEVVNNYSQDDLERIIRTFGEERFSKVIAKKIAAERKNGRITTTGGLAKIVANAIPESYQRRKINPATKTFQALRIEVNQELENLKKFIQDAIEILAPGGRLAIITFHSLEDRIVKNIFRENARGCICPPNFPKCLCNRKAGIKIITKKPIVPSGLEAKNNPRSRSAKLRVCEKL